VRIATGINIAFGDAWSAATTLEKVRKTVP
jgi:hypothetical protein